MRRFPAVQGEAQNGRMMRRVLLSSASVAALLFAGMMAPMSASAGDVTIYRCVGKDGALTLRDSPCRAGETQQVRNMVRPKDPPKRRMASAPVAAAAATQPAAVHEIVVVRTPAQPMYECVNGETGERYVSDSGEGTPRWISYPAYAYAPLRPPPARPADGISVWAGSDRSRVSVNLPLGPAYPPVGVIPVIGSTLVRDACHALPPQEACARLSDRKYEIMRRYNSALQSERARLDLEQRGIEARMQNDCGTY